MIKRVLRFLFSMVCLVGVGLVLYLVWTENLAQPVTVKTGNFGQKLKTAIRFDKNRTEKPSLVKIKDKKFEVEVVDTEKDRQRGLMYRESLAENKGMLFIFDKPAPYDFWMPNVNFPLDIVWIDEGFEVVDIKTVPPCKELKALNCPSYPPEGAAKYVLEVNAETFPGLIGDKVVLELN